MCVCVWVYLIGGGGGRGCVCVGGGGQISRGGTILPIMVMSVCCSELQNFAVDYHWKTNKTCCGKICFLLQWLFSRFLATNLYVLWCIILVGSLLQMDVLWCIILVGSLLQIYALFHFIVSNYMIGSLHQMYYDMLVGSLLQIYVYSVLFRKFLAIR